MSFVEIDSNTLQTACKMAQNHYCSMDNAVYQAQISIHGVVNFATEKQRIRLDTLISLTELQHTVIVSAEDALLLTCFTDCKRLLIEGKRDV